MSVIQDTHELLSGFPHIDELYINVIPDDKKSVIDLTQALLREVQIETGEEGNNDFNSINVELELQVFFKKHIDFDTEKFETDLLKLLVKNHYNVDSLGGKLYDPDTGQLTMTWFITLEKFM